MHIKSFRVENFRRLRSVRIDLDKEATVFVGANNSGKTSATHVFQRFLDPKARFQIYDFSAYCWEVFDSFDPVNEDPQDLPEISFDLWLEVDDENIHRVMDLMPGLDWDGEPIGVRMAYAPKDPRSLIQNYQEARKDRKKSDEKVEAIYEPWPRSLTDYLSKRLLNEYEMQCYILDSREFDNDLLPKPGYEPHYLATGSSSVSSIVSKLIRVDFLHAQRHLADSESHGRSEDLSRRLSRYYQRNLQKFEAGLDALEAIAGSESALNQHLEQAFESILKSIDHLGYPGSVNPGLMVKASFDIQNILSTSARVHYSLPGASGNESSRTSLALPDLYNGLGYKNLIYMAVEIFDFHLAWENTGDERPPVHLIIIEEPEAHLHAQLQQIFISRVIGMLPEAKSGFHTQMVVTTHSSHVLYERNFRSIRYFCRERRNNSSNFSDVKDLSIFYGGGEDPTRKFLQQYLKLTHCDLFFADAAILVEGNVERLLLPLVIEQHISELKKCHLTILEVGGAFAHVFQELLEFLEITTLVITDLDSVSASQEPNKEGKLEKNAKACMTTESGAVTSNETLKHWFREETSIEELLDLDDSRKIVHIENGGSGKIRVAYQTRQSAVWNGEKADLAGRTLEEAFALENLDWTQEQTKSSIGLQVRGSDSLSLQELHKNIYEKVRNLDKTRFALALIAEQDKEWKPPQYILDGLNWLSDQMLPTKEVPPPSSLDLEELR
ncbi:AAA family ATPase [Streptosporangium sp. NPDC023615]|uniref:ATP-dependent nuclease n=1 Tax=Streptosporangium sp. NPDC023615 TaxID=3154794 RepID=UPI003430D12D